MARNSLAARIENRSAFHVTARIRPIVDFVSTRCRFADGVTVGLFDTKEPTQFTGGYAWKHRPTADGKLQEEGPPYVKLTLCRLVTYPRTTRHVDEVGEVKVRTWEEEIVFVLAHELGHIEDFLAGVILANANHAEVRAERFAKATLNAYRSGCCRKGRGQRAVRGEVGR